MKETTISYDNSPWNALPYRNVKCVGFVYKRKNSTNNYWTLKVLCLNYYYVDKLNTKHSRTHTHRLKCFFISFFDIFVRNWCGYLFCFIVWVDGCFMFKNLIHWSAFHHLKVCNWPHFKHQSNGRQSVLNSGFFFFEMHKKNIYLSYPG